MKRTISIFGLWILALSFMLWSSWAQTNTPTIFTADGGLTMVPASGGGAVIVPVSSLDAKISAWTDAIQNMLLGALGIVATLGLLWGRIMQLKASVVPTLIKTVEASGTPELKAAIEQAALRAGVEPAMNKAVKQHTVSEGNPFPKPRDYAEELKAELLPLNPVTLPVVEPPKTI